MIVRPKSEGIRVLTTKTQFWYMYEDSQRDMASCEFANGIINVRGTLSKKTYIEKGKRITCYVIAKVTSSGKQRVYLRRTVEDIKPKKRIPKARKINIWCFERAAKAYKELTPEQRNALIADFKQTNGIFNGKQYFSVTGYCIARFYHEERDKILPRNNG